MCWQPPNTFGSRASLRYARLRRSGLQQPLTRRPEQHVYGLVSKYLEVESRVEVLNRRLDIIRELCVTRSVSRATRVGPHRAHDGAG